MSYNFENFLTKAATNEKQDGGTFFQTFSWRNSFMFPDSQNHELFTSTTGINPTIEKEKPKDKINNEEQNNETDLSKEAVRSSTLKQKTFKMTNDNSLFKSRSKSRSGNFSFHSNLLRKVTNEL